MPVGIFRGGCLTGSHHSAVQLHGFLAYLVKVAVRGDQYTIFGHRGKQVRGNIHSVDVVSAFHEFYLNPRAGEVYNIGGGRDNSVSIVEAIDAIERLTGNRIRTAFQEEPRKGDHICYISDLAKLRAHFPNWRLTRSLGAILEEMVSAERPRLRIAS